MQPDLILVPFAQDAPAVNVDDIPVNLGPSDPPQAASWSQGFPTVTMTPLAAGGIPPRGQSFNGVLQDITQHLVYIGGGGQYKWSSAYVTAKGGYSIGDVIQADNGLLSYVSLVDNNTDNFNTDPASIGPKWRAWAGSQVPDATTTQRGAVLIATQSQVNFGVGDAVVTPATRAVAAQTQAACAFATSGSGTAQVLSPSPAITSYASNQRFNVTFNVGSGATPTINVSGLGPKSLKQYNAAGAKVAAVFAAGQNSDIVYDGVDFVVLGQLPSSTGVTAPQFDSSVNLATTAFVSRVGKQYSSIAVVNANYSATVANAGGMVLGNSTVPFNVTLPLASSFPSGTTITVYCYAGGTMQVIAGGSDTIIFAPAQVPSFSVPQGFSVTLTSNGGAAWYTEGLLQATETIIGSARVATNTQMATGTDDATFVTPKKARAGFNILLAANGFIAFPSWLGGFVFQWAVGTNAAVSGGGVLAQDINFPFPFPSAVLGGIVSGKYVSGVATVAYESPSGLTNSKVSVSVANPVTTGSGTSQPRVFYFGH